MKASQMSGRALDFEPSSPSSPPHTTSITPPKKPHRRSSGAKAREAVEPPVLTTMYMDAIKSSMDLMPPRPRKDAPTVPLPSLFPQAGRAAVSFAPPRRSATAEPRRRKPRPAAARLPAALRRDGSRSLPVDFALALGVESLFGADELPVEIACAARSFDDRHTSLSAEAQTLLKKAGRAKTNPSRDEGAFNRVLDEMRRNRFYLDTPLTASVSCESVAPRRKKRMKWQVEESTWQPRSPAGFFETDEQLRKVFLLDWEVARQSHGLEHHIVKNSERDSVGRADAEGEYSNFEEVLAVREALQRHERVIYGVFDFYAARYSEDIIGECDIFNLTYNAYISFLAACKVPTRDCPMRNLETIWAIVNAKAQGAVKNIDKNNASRTLNRQEFLQCLVRIAIEREVRPGKLKDVAQAVDVLLLHVANKVVKEALQNSNLFRKRFCYVEQTAKVMDRGRASVEALFTRYANLGTTTALNSSTSMSIGEWLTFLDHLGFFQWRLLSLLHAKLIFLWSRIRTREDHSNKSEQKLRCLQLKDFMEALVRLSTMIPLPTDEDIAEVGAANAAEYIHALQTKAEASGGANNAEWLTMLRERKQEWHHEPRQKVGRCAQHLLDYLVKTVEGNTSRAEFGAEDSSISTEEAAQFVLKRRKGAGLKRQDTRLLQGDFQKAYDAVRARVLESLRKVESFAQLSEAQLVKLRDAMVEAPFDEGEFVFEQDDVADTLFVIISGSAVAVREDAASGHEEVLAELGEGAVFGERALLKGEPRFAGVRAATKLKTMFVTKEDLHTAVGVPLHDLLEDKY
ncbi:hypothetical protein AB1Y20_014104 [Prymnesium parvum]|uniref:Cyclic nucleotide-binding domain-containing protein n=1 Tax=Prymnesium parvum TaxID=97485 RepID=A0AB34IID8_PRYPA